jgi:lipopolysaccharide/colanic/teichoic acid biosynthesis glycosyltransferase
MVNVHKAYHMTVPTREWPATAAHDGSSYGRQRLFFVGLLLVLDALAVLASLTLAYAIRISSGLLTYTADYDVATYRMLAILSVPVWLALFWANGLYRQDNLMGGSTEYKQAVKACGYGVIALIILVFFLWHDTIDISRVWLLLALCFSIALVVGERFLARRIAYFLRRAGWFTARVLIVGANDQGIAMAEQWHASAISGMQVIGFVDDFKPAGTVVFDDVRVIGRPTSLAQLVEQTGAHEVVVVPNAVAWETFEEIIALASAPKRYTLRLSPGFYEMLTTSIAVTNKTFVPLFTINEARIVGVDAILKKVLDYGLGLVLAAVALPVVLAITLARKMAHWDEPLLVRHNTIGQAGAMFTMYKFNTAPIASRRKHEGRLSWLEHQLYEGGLDKLPQLYNVLRGHMSLVGPRPRVLGSRAVDPRKVCSLCAVKPGIIGPWMVQECWTTEESHDELYYVRNWTIWLDLQILAQSVLSMLIGKHRVTPGRDEGKLQAPHADVTSARGSLSTQVVGLNFTATDNTTASSSTSTWHGAGHSSDRSVS